MANLGKAATISSDDRVVNQLQDNLTNKLNQLLGLTLLQGDFITASLAVGDNTINHMLGRKLIGWIVTLQDAASSIYDKQDSNTNSASTLILNASVATDVTIYVF